ncbi:hypothetical protein A3728_11165 [Sulfitobacter sp. HI0040]|nr:hypothetical protein A3728_11165 [Sulfitobacter sp. HI0040]KZZ70134.1 hypothetical protein A3764_08450 [Sulfitobacter sp. HI0129]
MKTSRPDILFGKVGAESILVPDLQIISLLSVAMPPIYMPTHTCDSVSRALHGAGGRFPHPGAVKRVLVILHDLPLMKFAILAPKVSL